MKTSFAMWACPSNVQRRQWQYCSRWYMSPNLPPGQVTIIIVAACDTYRLTFLHAPKNANYVHHDHHHHEHLDYHHHNIISSSLSENLMRVRLFLLPVPMLSVMMIMPWSLPSWSWFWKYVNIITLQQSGRKCVIVASAMRAEQGPCEPIKGCIREIREQ